MWGKRLKEKFQWNQQGSPFAAWTAVLLVLMAVVSVFVSLSDKRFFPTDSSPPHRYHFHGDSATLTASANHTYYWNDDGPLSIEEVRGRIATFVKEAGSPLISITGDSTASLGDTVRLVDEARRQGAKNVQILPPSPAKS